MRDPGSSAPTSAPRPAQLLEAVLFVSSRPISTAALLSATGLTEEETNAAISELQERYSSETSGIVLRNVAGGYQLSTNPACAAAVERFREEARGVGVEAARGHEAW